MTTIRDPETGQAMSVNNEGRGKVISVAETFDRHENHEHGAVWSLDFDDINPAGANDKFLYIENTSATKDYILTDFRLFASTTTGICRIKTVTGTPTYVTGTDVPPGSRNTRFNNSPSIVVKHDTDITGLSDTATIFQVPLSTVDTMFQLKTTSGLILSPGGACALEWGPATGEVSGIISIVELEPVN